MTAYTIVRHWRDEFAKVAGLSCKASRPVPQPDADFVYRRRFVDSQCGVDHRSPVVISLCRQATPDLKTTWLRHFPTDVVLPFLVLLLFRSYSRVWYLARVSEYAATGFAVVLGYAAAAGLHLLTKQTHAGILALGLHYLLLAGMAAPAVVFTRAALRVVQDLMQRRPRDTAGTQPGRVLVYGAGYRTSLFLRQAVFREPPLKPLDVIGLVSAIPHHWSHGARHPRVGVGHGSACFGAASAHRGSLPAEPLTGRAGSVAGCCTPARCGCRGISKRITYASAP